jgi:hypothetical protein
MSSCCGTSEAAPGMHRAIIRAVRPAIT